MSTKTQVVNVSNSCSSADNYWPELHALLPHDTTNSKHPMRIYTRQNGIGTDLNINLVLAHAHAHEYAKPNSDPGLSDLIKMSALAWKVYSHMDSDSNIFPTLIDQIIIESDAGKQTVIE